MLKGWPLPDATVWGPPIWNAFGHQRAVITCDPENMQQRRFTRNFKEKPKETDRVDYVNSGVGAGAEVTGVSPREEAGRENPSPGDSVVSILQVRTRRLRKVKVKELAQQQQAVQSGFRPTCVRLRGVSSSALFCNESTKDGRGDLQSF